VRPVDARLQLFEHLAMGSFDGSYGPTPPPVLGRMLVVRLQGVERDEVAMMTSDSDIRLIQASRPHTGPEQAKQVASVACPICQGMRS
jgi:hypothetical protein